MTTPVDVRFVVGIAAALVAVGLAAAAPTAWAAQRDCVNCSTDATNPHASVVGWTEAQRKALTPSQDCVEFDQAQLESARKDLEQVRVLTGQSKAPQITRTIRGRVVRGTAAELDLVTMIVRDRMADRLFPWLKGEVPAEWSTENRACLEVMCALKTVYRDEEIALRSLTIGLRDGYAFRVAKVGAKSKASDPEEQDSTREKGWDVESLREIDRALKQLPPAFKSKRQKLSGVSLSDELECVAKALSEGEIQALTGSGLSGETFVHEMAHLYDFARGRPKGFTQLDGGVRVSEYAKKDAYEDFAESVSHYFADPSALAERAPQKYRAIRDQVFGGVEFTDLSSRDSELSGLLAAQKLDRLALFKSCQKGLKIRSAASPSGANGAQHIQFEYTVKDASGEATFIDKGKIPDGCFWNLAERLLAGKKPVCGVDARGDFARRIGSQIQPLTRLWVFGLQSQGSAAERDQRVRQEATRLNTLFAQNPLTEAEVNAVLAKLREP
jgi:hypothetical protein